MDKQPIWELFTQEELKKLIPIAEQKLIDLRGKFPDDDVSALKQFVES